VNCVFKSSSLDLVYRSQIYKEQAVCSDNDFQCMYWQTTYQTSDDMMACYTPRIPEIDRPKFLATSSGGGAFQVYLEVIVGDETTMRIDCLSQACSIFFHDNYTPQLTAFGPAHFYVGSPLSIWLTPRRNNNIINLLNIKIGRSICAADIPDDYYSDWSNMYLFCNTGTDWTSETVTDFLVDFSFGQPSVNSMFEKYEIDQAKTPNTYYFKIFPFIESISSNEGTSNGGQTIEIRGRGFSPSDTKVYLNDDECVVDLNIASDLITCLLPKVSFTYTQDDPNNFFLGSHGLRRRVYTQLGGGSIGAMTQLQGFPDTTNNLYLDDILLETQTLPTNMENYGQYINGYFKALYTGKYRFWTSSDDNNLLFLSTDTSKENLVKIINFSSWISYRDYVSLSSTSRSDWIDLTKDTFYYMELFHAQGGGPEHYMLGVEIDTDESLVNDPNTITKFDMITIYPSVVSRDLYEIVVNTLNDKEYTMTCRMTDGTFKNFEINPNSSASKFTSQLGSLLGDSRLIVRKLGYNDENKYFLDEGEAFNDSSYSALNTFDKMYLNLSGAPSDSSIPLTTVSTGTKTGTVFLVFIDRKESERKYALENNCYLSSLTQDIIEITKLQSVSKEMSGTFSLKVTDNKDETNSYVTPDIDISTFNIYGVNLLLNNIPLLTNEIYTFSRGSYENVTFYIRYSKYADVTISVNNNLLAGGVNDKPTIEISDFLNGGNDNLFFLPIPPDFLYVKSKIIFNFFRHGTSN
jgi:hypothetical protein